MQHRRAALRQARLPLLPFRRQVVIGNLQRVFGDTLTEEQITQLAQAHYGHIWRLLVEFLRYPLMPQARRDELARVENLEVLLAPRTRTERASCC